MALAPLSMTRFILRWHRKDLLVVVRLEFSSKVEIPFDHGENIAILHLTA